MAESKWYSRWSSPVSFLKFRISLATVLGLLLIALVLQLVRVSNHGVDEGHNSFASWGAPKFARGLTCDNWRNCDGATQKFDASLHKRFPVGTSAQNLKSVMFAQGFHHLSSPVAKCLKDGEESPVGKLTIRCPSWDQNWDPRNELVYQWGWLPCGKQVSVRWSEDGEGRLIHLEGRYDMTCL
jgi:hypothetical protein